MNAAIATSDQAGLEVWERGYCPVCGSNPTLSLFGENGRRFLVCGFCWHKWPSSRMFCHNCGNRDHDTLRYYTFEDEEAYRTDVCDKCRHYIKTVDCRVLGRFVYPPLECIATSHLDIKMQDMGFENSEEYDV
jgi:FdhE protein